MPRPSRRSFIAPYRAGEKSTKSFGDFTTPLIIRISPYHMQGAFIFET